MLLLLLLRLHVWTSSRREEVRVSQDDGLRSALDLGFNRTEELMRGLAVANYVETALYIHTHTVQ